MEQEFLSRIKTLDFDKNEDKPLCIRRCRET